jgi:outer membrane protein assembly factor BamB
VLWQRATGRSVNDGIGVAVVDGRSVALLPGGESACLWAVDAHTGDVRYRYEAGQPVFGSTLVVGGVALCTAMYGGNKGNALHAVDVATGKRRFVVAAGYGGALHVFADEDPARAWAALGLALVLVDVESGAEVVRTQLKHEVVGAAAADGALFVADTHDLVAYGVAR